MSSSLDIDPYAVLGVAKEATLPEIKSAHRKLVLRCHPDKIKDESQRSQAQDEFQKVQQAYELLSDETRRTKYDQKVRIAELRREVSSSRASSSREFRNGRIYEERTPPDAFDDDAAYSEELPRTTSRKFDEFSARPRTKASSSTEEKRKSKSVPLSTTRSTKDSVRDAKATHSNRDKYRTKERRRDVYEKRERAAPSPYIGPEEDDDSDSSTVWVRVKRPSSSKQSSSSSTRKSKSAGISIPRYEVDYSDGDEYKYEKQERTVQDYIHSSRKASYAVDVDARHRSSRSPLRYQEYETAEPEPLPPRRSKRSSKENVRSSSSRHGSYEQLDPHEHVPSLPTAATSPASKSSRPPLQSVRSASSYRAKREGSRSELYNMVYDNPPRTSKQRYDSGYSSPGTDMPPAEDLPKSSSTRYKVNKESSYKEPEKIIIEPVPPHASPRQHRTRSPTHQTSRASKPPRSNTANYPYFPESRFEAVRPSASRSSSTRYFNEIPRPGDGVKYREVRPGYYDDLRHPPRRQSTYA